MIESRTRLYIFTGLPAGVLRYLVPSGDRPSARAGRIVHPDRRHITLLDLAIAAYGEDEVIAAVRTVMARLALVAFRVVFDELVVTADRALLHASQPVAGAIALQDRLRHALARAGLALPASAAPDPHVTLGYRCRPPFGCWPILPISWTVTDLALVRSHVGQTRHETIARWPLPPRPAVAA